jgi:restriction endonuclease Mrr
MTSPKRVNAAIVQPLKEALALAFWYKKDLRAFLSTVLPDVGLVAHLDWTDYKRNIVHQLLDTLVAHQDKYLDELLDLLLATADITDPSHLKRIEDGEQKYKDAVVALTSLRAQVEPYREWRNEAEEASRRRREEDAKAAVQRAISDKLLELKRLLYELIADTDHQKRGYALERLLNQMFALFDIDAKASFRVVGEQIDGAFTFEGTEYLLEAKWQQHRSDVPDLDSFAGKIGRKLENTLGLFMSVNGFQDSVIETYSQNRPRLFLMDGADLSAVLEDRIPLPDLLRRKRQHASRTGEVFISAYQILGGGGSEDDE